MPAPRPLGPFSAEAARDYLLLDVRPRAERWGELGLIPGSVGVPDRLRLANRAHEHAATSAGERTPLDLTTVSLSAVLAELDLAAIPASRVALVCAGGHRASRLAERWQRDLSLPLAYVEGGVLGWAGGGLPLVRKSLPTHLTDPELHRLRRTVLSCFVAEHAERALDHAPAVTAPLSALTAASGDEFSALEALVRTLDRAAFLSREQGVASARIAENLTHLVTLAI